MPSVKKCALTRFQDEPNNEMLRTFLKDKIKAACAPLPSDGDNGCRKAASEEFLKLMGDANTADGMRKDDWAIERLAEMAFDEDNDLRDECR